MNEQRGLTREQVAAYLGISTDAAADWQRRGLIPGPIPGTHRWDRKAIDRALDRLSGIASDEPQLSPLEQWKRERAGRPQAHAQGQGSAR
jgi:hypothetical protein